MKLTADNGDFLELEALPPDVDDSDVLLLVRARFHGFSAEVDVWVMREAWMGFTQELVVLEERRQGVAKLESISPGELSLVIRSTSAGGHMGAEAPSCVKGRVPPAAPLADASALETNDHSGRAARLDTSRSRVATPCPVHERAR